MTLLSKYAGIESGVRDDVAIEFRASVSDTRTRLLELLKYLPTPEDVADLAIEQVFRKYDEYLPSDVLECSFITNIMNYPHATQELRRLV
jgi:hypothetical protein